jgi:rhodanese-related sulfurtransferase
MTKMSVLFVLLLGIVTVEAAASPQIAVDVAKYAFPDTVEGIAVEHTFVLSNIGDQELVIESVEPSCSCTKIAAELAASRLQPGQSVNLNAILDTNGLSGDEAKMLIITSNDPGPDGDYKTTLSFTGTVIERQPYQESVGNLYYDSYILLDVRDPAAYAAGHLIGALNVPASRVASLADGLPRSALTVIYDQDGASSALSEVTRSLHGAGVAAVYALVGGLDQWEKSYGSARMASAADASWGPFVQVSGTSSYSSSDVVQKYYVGQLRTDYVLIDMRAPAAFAAGHLAGAVNLTEAELSAYIDALPRETPIIVYSEDGTDSERAVYSLWMLGSRAESLLGGLTEWEKLYGSFLLVSSAS